MSEHYEISKKTLFEEIEKAPEKRRNRNVKISGNLSKREGTDMGHLSTENYIVHTNKNVPFLFRYTRQRERRKSREKVC